jgi:hypothetical protein
MESLTDNDGAVYPAVRWASGEVAGKARGTTMPRTKKHQPGLRSQTAPPPASVNGPAGDVLTLAEAAAYLRVPEIRLQFQGTGSAGNHRFGKVELALKK